MVTHNVAVASGIANGTKATVSRFCWTSDTVFSDATVTVNSISLRVRVPSSLPIAIIIRMDDSLASFTPPSPQLSGLSSLSNREFPILLRSGSTELSSIQFGFPQSLKLRSFRQFPMVARFAFTCYKVQGDTLHQGVVVAFWKSPEQQSSSSPFSVGWRETFLFQHTLVG